MQERRRSPRYWCSQMVEMSCRTEEDVVVTTTVLLEDVSREGAAVSVEAPIAAGKMVELRAPGFQAHARVRFCRPRENDFHLGLEFPSGVEWQPDQWQPEHLFLPSPRD